MSDSFAAWSPLPNLRGEFDLVTLVDDEDGFHITLKNDTGRALKIDFLSVLAYRLTGRVLSPSSWKNIEAYSEEVGTLFRTQESPWIEEMREKQNEIDEIDWASLVHILVSLPGEIIEVLCDEEPNVAWTNSLFGDAI